MANTHSRSLGGFTFFPLITVEKNVIAELSITQPGTLLVPSRLGREIA